MSGWNVVSTCKVAEAGSCLMAACAAPAAPEALQQQDPRGGEAVAPPGRPTAPQQHWRNGQATQQQEVQSPQNCADQNSYATRQPQQQQQQQQDPMADGPAHASAFGSPFAQQKRAQQQHEQQQQQQQQSPQLWRCSSGCESVASPSEFGPAAAGANASYSSVCSSAFGCGPNVSLTSAVSGGSTVASVNGTGSAWSSGRGACDDDDESCSTCGTSDSGCVWILSRYGGREVLADYEFGLPLGRGTFGVTRLVTERVSARPYACKTVCKERIASRQYIEDMRSEVKILQHLVGVPGVVQLRGAYEDCRAVNLVLELCAGGDLLDHILLRGRLPEDDAAAAARAIVLALQRCHARGVMHRDVKPENFLLAADGCAASCRASDFGVSAFCAPGQKFREIVGTPYYMAPEVLLRCYDQSADIWSAGVILYLMLTGQLPFMGANDRQVCAAVLRGSVSTEGDAWEGVSEGAKSVVRRMLCRDPKARATAEELLAHPWLAREAVVVAVAAAQAPQPPAAALAPASKAGVKAPAGAAAARAAAPAAGGPRGASRSLCSAPSALPPRPRACELRSISASAVTAVGGRAPGRCGAGRCLAAAAAERRGAEPASGAPAFGG
ncbi:hypothetical protein Rsub_01210 [Raphidocelis subcapitata]|uniref:Protein kinase domain-containing protein n=1 Tax=Raphidocelis subcapitata TaxID=307507 RepID=A0A2V0NU92_9CHLO|nr:hypothetical protein Rsub_01210 [Raphidocelis subcapitata]|eukprot:GBF88497.1 hypothetical protein Rsub_01210 [Raphidocelis subcapitata]